MTDPAIPNHRKCSSLLRGAWVRIPAPCHTKHVSGVYCLTSLNPGFLVCILRWIISSSLWCGVDHTRKDVWSTQYNMKVPLNERMQMSYCVVQSRHSVKSSSSSSSFFPLSFPPSQSNNFNAHANLCILRKNTAFKENNLNSIQWMTNDHTFNRTH